MVVDGKMKTKNQKPDGVPRSAKVRGAKNERGEIPKLRHYDYAGIG